MKELFSNNSFKNLMDILDVSIYCKNIDGEYVFCNKYMLDMAGISDLNKIVGKKDS
jgi:PAS domain-containing protein